MRLSHLVTAIMVFLVVATCLQGCAPSGGPKETVLVFIEAVRGADSVTIEKNLSFERLLIEKDGELYQKLPPYQRMKALEKFRENMLYNLTAGKSRAFGEIDPEIIKETVLGDRAEVVVVNRKNKEKSFVYSLAREGGTWKIYRVVEH